MGVAGLESCGSIVGLGETDEDRIALLYILANLTPPPTSVPINALVPVAGTPLGQLPPPDPLLLPMAQIRLSAGRKNLSESAGANSIFTGEKLLTPANPGQAAAAALLEKLGLQPL
ncbi:hypothetical protein NW822_03825 [Synechococcus sp. H70.2]